jgi:hypothetical protein
VTGRPWLARLRPDATARVVLGVESVPDGLASGVLTGVVMVVAGSAAAGCCVSCPRP